MKQLINFVATIMNWFHKGIVGFAKGMGLSLTDKALHFIVIGAIGMMAFACVYVVLKLLRKNNINLIASVCSFAMVVALAVAIEVLQGATGSGCMEFADIAYGLYGFASALTVYYLIKVSLVMTSRMVAYVKMHRTQYEHNTF